MQQILSPRMQDCDKADLSAQMLGVRCNGVQRLSGSLEQDVVDHRFVLERDGCDFLWDGEDHVEVFNRQKFSLPVLEPLVTREGLAFWAMSIATAVVGDAVVAAGITLLYVTAQCDASALFNCAHDTRLPPTQVSRMFRTVSRADSAKDVRHLQPASRLLKYLAQRSACELAQTLYTERYCKPKSPDHARSRYIHREPIHHASSG